MSADRHLNPDDFPEVRFLSLKEYNLLQIEHIDRHKWYLSEEKGAEVTFEEAFYDWIDSGLAVEFRTKFKVETSSYRKQS